MINFINQDIMTAVPISKRRIQHILLKEVIYVEDKKNRPIGAPDIGIVMPIYKQIPKFLRLALHSILNQSYGNFKLIIVLDGAPLNVTNLVAELTKNDPRVSIIDHKVNKGVSKALNTGFEVLYKMPGIKYLTWVSSDNIHYRTMLEKLRNGFISPNIGLVYSSFWQIDAKGEKVYRETTKEAFMDYQDQPKEKLLDYCFIGTSFMYRNEIAQTIRGYYLEPVEDYDYWLRFTEKCDIHFVKEMLMEYRVNSPESISTQIKSSSQQHRKFRYSLNLARYQARKRRGIPTELTIIIPLNHRRSINLNIFELLLEQYYSNFTVLLIDKGNIAEALNLTKLFPDPRVMIIKPHSPSNSLVKYALPYVDTQFVSVFSDNSTQYTNKYYLENTIKQRSFNRSAFQKGDVYITSDFKKILGR
ncbi:glycosyltransferase family 2 protein [Lysinibacillus sphaericus]